MNSIITRKSIRTFTGEKITDIDKQKIVNYLNREENLIGINGSKIRFELRVMDGNKSGKIGTYGFIKNAPAFLIAICKNNDENMLDCGYVFEKLILFLEGIGIGTCWLGGTFNRKKLGVAEKLEDGEFIPVISPLGYASEKKSFMDKQIRKSAKSDSRLDFDSLFFYNDFNTKIVDKEIREILEMVRLAPSASNKQPWRLVIDNDKNAHFFIERTPNYAGNKLGYDIQLLDIGIALSHYEMVSGKSDYYKGKPDIDMLSEYREYVVSVRA